MRFITVILFLLLVGCGPAKRIAKTTTTSTTATNNTVAKDSTAVIKQTQPIAKEQSISLKTTDSLVNQRINQALANFKFTERSGSNHTTAYYDAETMQLLIQSFVAATQDKTVATNTDSATETTLATTIDNYLYEKVVRLPWWAWVLAAVWLLPMVIDRLKLLFFPLLKLLNENKS